MTTKETQRYPKIDEAVKKAIKEARERSKDNGNKT